MTKARFFGLCQPYGYQNNRFVFFHTPSVEHHKRATIRSYNDLKANNTGSTCTIYCPPPHVIYSNYAYRDFYQIHISVLNCLGHGSDYGSNTGSDYGSNTGSDYGLHTRFRYWPVITLEGSHYQMVNDIDKFITEKILIKKE